MARAHGILSSTVRSSPHAGRNCTRGVDAQGQIVASAVTESSEQDPSQVPLLSQRVRRCDGPFARSQVIIPPRKDAVLSSMVSTTPTQRRSAAAGDRVRSGLPGSGGLIYDDQAYVENACQI